MVKALPAMPAMLQPSPKVTRSTRPVSMPTAPAMTRLPITARTRLPRGERKISIQTATIMPIVMHMTMMPLIGTSTVSVSCAAPIILSGSSTPTSRAPSTNR